MSTRRVPAFFALLACGQTSIETTSAQSVGELPPAFRVAWVKPIGSAGAQSLTAIFAGRTRAFLTGTWDTTLDFHDGDPRTAGDSNAHAFIAASDVNGQPLWHRGFSGQVGFEHVTGTPDEDVVASGSSIDADAGCGVIPGTGGFLAKYAGASGLCLWMRLWPTTRFYGIAAVSSQPDGGLVVAGQFSGTVDLGGGEVIESQNEFGTIYVAGLDSRGHGRWARVLGEPSAGSTSTISVADMSTDEEGNVYITGTFGHRVDLGGKIYDFGVGPIPAYAVAFDSQGMTRWRYVNPHSGLAPTSIHGHAHRVAVYGIATQAFQFAGRDFPVAQSALFTLDFGSDGHERWGRTFETTSGTSVFPGNIVIDDGGKLNFAAAFFSGAIDIDGTSFGASGPTEHALLTVLDSDSGSALRANILGDDGADLQNVRLSFGPTTLRLFGGDLIGTSHMGNRLLTAVGRDAFYSNLTH